MMRAHEVSPLRFASGVAYQYKRVIDPLFSRKTYRQTHHETLGLRQHWLETADQPFVVYQAIEAGTSLITTPPPHCGV